MKLLWLFFVFIYICVVNCSLTIDSGSKVDEKREELDFPVFEDDQIWEDSDGKEMYDFLNRMDSFESIEIASQEGNADSEDENIFDDDMKQVDSEHQSENIFKDDMKQIDYEHQLENIFEDDMKQADSEHQSENIFEDDMKQIDYEHQLENIFGDDMKQADYEYFIHSKPEIKDKETERNFDFPSYLQDEKDYYELEQYPDGEIPSFKFDKEIQNDMPIKLEEEKLYLELYAEQYKILNDENENDYKDYNYFLDKLNQDFNDYLDARDNTVDLKFILYTNSENKVSAGIVSINENNAIEDSEITNAKKLHDWEVYSDAKYFDGNEYTDNNDFEERSPTRTYLNRSTMFMISTVIMVSSIVLVGFCLLCKIVNPKKSHKLLQKNQNYEALNEELA